jgi:hypothetical protein
VISQDRAFFALDSGSATTSAALVGHVGGRWRLVAQASAPVDVDVDDVLLGLLSQVARADPQILTELGGGDDPDVQVLVGGWARLVARTTPARRIAVVAGSRRQRRRLEAAALRAGWLVSGGSADEDDPVELSRLILSVETSAVLLGADHRPGGDEKRHLPDLVALLAAATRSRPELTVVLAGGAAAFESAFSTPNAVSEELEPAGPARLGAAAQPDAASGPDLAARSDVAGPEVEKAVESKRTANLELGPSELVDDAGAAGGEAPTALATERADDAEEAETTEAAEGTEGAETTGAAEASASASTGASGPEGERAEAQGEAADPEQAGEAALVGESEQAGEPENPATEGNGGPAPQVVEEPDRVSAQEGPAASLATAAPSAEPSPTPAAGSRTVPTHVLLAPDAEAGRPAGSSLQQVLEGLRALPNDSRLGIRRSIASLAYVLDRSIEMVEVGLEGGLLTRSEPFGPGHSTILSSHACLADGSFAPASPSEEVIDGVLAWATMAMDRHRAMDRLHDLRLVPWGEADGEGANFRLAAVKAACGRLIEAMPELAEQPMPELLVAGGGVLAALPPSVVALALADLVRRPGVSLLAVDQARLLGPLGVIEDEAERRRLLANLADDILMPLGSLIMPAGIKPGRSAGQLRLKGSASASEIELHPGSVQVVDLPPGSAARADLEFRDAVRLGRRGHHFSVDVGGGLSGLLVDLRDVPMRISDRPDSRRAALDAWQRGMWPEVDE